MAGWAMEEAENISMVLWFRARYIHWFNGRTISTTSLFYEVWLLVLHFYLLCRLTGGGPRPGQDTVRAGIWCSQHQHLSLGLDLTCFVIRHPSFVICHLSSVIHNLLSVIRRLSSVIPHPSFVIHRPSSVIHYPSFVIPCPPFVIRHPSSVGGIQWSDHFSWQQTDFVTNGGSNWAFRCLD